MVWKGSGTVPGGKAPRAAGDYFERRTRDGLEHAGFVVIRSGGSLGPADLVAMRKDGPPLLISCKKGGYLPRPELFTLCETAERAGAVAILARQRRPGWALLEYVGKHTRTAYADIHFPARGAVG